MLRGHFEISNILFSGMQVEMLENFSWAKI